MKKFEKHWSTVQQKSRWLRVWQKIEVYFSSMAQFSSTYIGVWSTSTYVGEWHTSTTGQGQEYYNTDKRTFASLNAHESVSHQSSLRQKHWNQRLSRPIQANYNAPLQSPRAIYRLLNISNINTNSFKAHCRTLMPTLTLTPPSTSTYNFRSRCTGGGETDEQTNGRVPSRTSPFWPIRSSP